MRSVAIELTRGRARARVARLPRPARGLVLSLLATVVFVVAIEVIALLVRQWSAPGPVSSGLGRLLDPWNRYDAQWYTWIADSGYTGVGRVSATTHLYESSVAFAPLFPVTVRGIDTAFHLTALVAATAVVMVSLVAAVVGLYRLATIDHPSRVGVGAVIAMLSFPTALFLIAPYAEAPMLALGIWSFVAARRRRWGLAAVLVGAAVAVKLYAVVLVAGLLVEVVGAERGRRALAAAAAVVIAPALAIGGWMAWQAAVLGDPLSFLRAESAWGRHLEWPMRYLRSTFPAIWHNVHYLLPSLLDLAAPFLLIGAGLYAWRIRRSYAVVMLLSAVVFSSTSVYDSIDRYALGVFPLFIVLAVLLAPRPRLGAGVAGFSAAVGGACVFLFATQNFIG